eukprot:TRINITY_DN4850_c0_g1_i3.p1 TRINITY_DN4850_c0_g1~~TRINITY_DN4850_c0_g1_i3.p1  ORF type:complete len:433 (+),score=91.41 TRINITY_DN4850_c0_g1_i3:637-1935(+)
MKLPKPMIELLRKKGIKKPSPIQVQCLPAVLSGRDVIGIAFTGSGKTLVFALPMILFSLEEEIKLPVIDREGPFCLNLCPSRELAYQTHKIIKEHTQALYDAGYPKLNVLLCTGGIKIQDQLDEMRGEGIHMVVATPGRLADLLNRRKLSLSFCKYFCLDEADRLLDEGFEEEVRKIMDHFTGQRQTILISATMPLSMQNFGKSALVKPIEVYTSRAGAANLDVLQEIEYVVQQKKIVSLLEALQKTPPPVLIFCENKNDVDDITEYLLLKKVRAVSLHAGKDQDERREAIEQFMDGKKDVLIATDVASKGIDFPNIQHVINFDMPKEIENYVHRIGRTGRCGKTGTATTFVNQQTVVPTLLDLRALLIESKQRVPKFLQQLGEEDDKGGSNGEKKGCSYCGGLGHTFKNCPKAEDRASKQIKSIGRDFLRQ